MTYKEAKEVLKELSTCSYVDSFEDEEIEALKKAIKALDIEETRCNIITLSNTIKGEITIMCCTKDPAEFDAMYGSALKNLNKLSKMIYDSNFAPENKK